MPARAGETFACAQQCTVVMVNGDIFLCCLRAPVVLQSFEAGFDYSAHWSKGRMLLANSVRDADGMIYDQLTCM